MTTPFDLSSLIEPQRMQDPMAWRELAWKCVRQDRRDWAEICFQRITVLAPELVEGWANLAALARGRREFELAAKYYTRAAALEPGNLRLLKTLVDTFREARMPIQAIPWCEKILEADPSSVEAQLLIGNVYQELEQCDISMSYLSRAHALQPDNPACWNSLAILNHRLGEIEEGIRQFREAIRRDLSNQDYRFHLGMALLLAGQYREGWEMFEHRPGGRYCRRDAKPGKLWNGEQLHEQTLLLAAEQGLGDTVQAVRFASLIRSCYGGTLVLSCQERLKPLLSQVDGIFTCVARTEPHPPIDYYIPLLSVPSILDYVPTETNTRIPYIHPEPARVAKWAAYFQNLPKANVKKFLRVAISWQGDPTFAADRSRSIPLDAFRPLAECPGISLVSLQKGFGSEQLANISWAHHVQDITQEWDGPGAAFLDCIAILQSVDLLVTSDSAIAHVAGAIGVPVWILLPRVPDWRWGMEGATTPWYPTARLFRQTQQGDWTHVMAEVVKSLMLSKDVETPECNE